MIDPAVIHKVRFPTIAEGMFAREVEVTVEAFKVLAVGLDAEHQPSVWYVTGHRSHVVRAVFTGSEVPVDSRGRYRPYVGTFTFDRWVVHAFAWPEGT